MESEFRMKIKATWKLIIYIVIVIMAAFAAVFVNTPVGYMPFMIILFSGVICFIWLLILRKNIECEVETDNISCERGRESPFRVSVNNKCILPAPGIRIEFFISDEMGEDTRTNELFISLSPKEKRSFSFDAGFSHIGVYRSGTRKIELRDPFGVFMAVQNKENSYSLEILPQVVVMSTLPVNTNVHMETMKARIQSPLSGSEYTSVREYTFGDPIKSIHWKLSAHAGNLMTKEMESYSNAGVSIIMDMAVAESDGDDRLDEWDAVIEAGAAAGDWALRNGLEYDLMFYNRNGVISRYVPSSFRALNGIIREFRVSKPSDENNIQKLVEEECSSVYSQANIVLCTTSMNDALSTSLAMLKQRGLNPIVLFVMSDNFTEREKENRMSSLKQLSYSNIPCKVISSARELEV